MLLFDRFKKIDHTQYYCEGCGMDFDFLNQIHFDSWGGRFCERCASTECNCDED
jgi:hypothetical protein